MMDWLNSNSGAVNAILAAILVVITFVYAYLTRRQVLESKELREMTIRPTLVVTAEIHEIHINIINFRVENIGGGGARNIRLRTSREFMIGYDRSLNEVGLFKRGIPLLGPGRNIETFLANALDQPNLLRQEPLHVTVEYEDTTGRKFKEPFEIDFRSFRNLRRVGTPPLQVIADSVKKLQENVGNLSNCQCWFTRWTTWMPKTPPGIYFANSEVYYQTGARKLKI